MATITKEMLEYLQSLGLGNTQAPIEMAVPGFAQNFANYQAIPESAQYNPYAVLGDGLPYEQIMARMNSQNYAPSPYGGLLGLTNNGGYNPSIGSSLNQAVLENYQGYSGVRGGGGGGGGGAGGAGAGGGGTVTNPFSDLTKAEQAAFYNANPAFAAATQIGQKGFNATILGMIQNALTPNLQPQENVVAHGFVPSNFVDPGLAVAADAAAVAQENSNVAAGLAVAADAEAAAGGGGGGGGGGDGNTGGGPGTGADGDAAFSKGGMVHTLLGPDPQGPDDGMGYLDKGEYVIKKSSVNKYGRGLLDMINEGKVPAKKMKSLLG
jgi:hypothetical protein